MRPQPHTSNGLILTRSCAVVVTFLVGTFSFMLSFHALRDLGARSHIPAEWAWMWPAIIDGTILLATLGVVTLASAPERQHDRSYFWKLLIGSATASIAFNMIHAYLPTDAPLPVALSALIAATAPISLLLTTHGLVVLGRKSTPTASDMDTPSGEAESESAEPDDDEPSRETRDSTPHRAHGRPRKQRAIDVRDYARWNDMASAVIARAPIHGLNQTQVATALYLSYDKAFGQREVGEELKISHNTVGKIVNTCAQLMREGQVMVAEAS